MTRRAFAASKKNSSFQPNIPATISDPPRRLPKRLRKVPDYPFIPRAAADRVEVAEHVADDPFRRPGFNVLVLAANTGVEIGQELGP